MSIFANASATNPRSVAVEFHGEKGAQATIAYDKLGDEHTVTLRAILETWKAGPSDESHEGLERLFGKLAETKYSDLAFQTERREGVIVLRLMNKHTRQRIFTVSGPREDVEPYVAALVTNDGWTRWPGSGDDLYDAIYVPHA